jgi:hypothetical protein
VAILAIVRHAGKDADGWMHLNQIGTQLRKDHPDLKIRHLQQKVMKIAELELRQDGGRRLVRLRPA